MTARTESPSARGARFEIMISADLMRQGWQVYRALSPVGKTDLIAIKKNILVKIQCKSTIDRWHVSLEGNDVLAVVNACGGPVRYFFKRGSTAMRLFESCKVLKRKKTA